MHPLYRAGQQDTRTVRSQPVMPVCDDVKNYQLIFLSQKCQERFKAL